MAQISATDVKKLRDATGAGMMDCKKALTEADGDYEKAVEILRVSGQAKAQKRGAERSATNGLVASEDGALLQLGAETDFVAKNQEFQDLAAEAVKAVAASRADTVEAVATLAAHPDFTLSNPNRMRALVGAFAANQRAFHDSSGRGYRFLGDMILAVDRLNPQTAAKLVPPLGRWRRFDPARQELMQAELMRIVETPGLSKDVFEQASKSLG